MKYPGAVVVRERALDRQSGPQKSRTIEVLHKVVGIADLYAYAFGGKEFDEIDPKGVKVSITGDKDAEKQTVAEGLKQFVGEYHYACDDESDAAAVGVAWLLIQNMIDDPLAKKDDSK